MGKERPPRVAPSVPGALGTVAPALPFALRLLCPASFRHRQDGISPVGMCGFVSLIAQILVLNPYISRLAPGYHGTVQQYGS